jgi:hypothetical protein
MSHSPVPCPPEMGTVRVATDVSRGTHRAFVGEVMAPEGLGREPLQRFSLQAVADATLEHTEEALEVLLA